MENGIYYIHCDRPGCYRIIGAQRFENGKKVEEEWEPDAVVTEDKQTFCGCCINKKEEFRTPDELQEGELEDVYSCD